MQTQCNAEQLQFSCVGRRRVVAAFDVGQVTSDAGALLLMRTDQAIGLIDRLARCFIDRRSQSDIEHSVRTLVGQRVLGIAAGYEDLNDHDALRADPLWAAVIGKLEAKRAQCASCGGGRGGLPARSCCYGASKTRWITSLGWRAMSAWSGGCLRRCARRKRKPPARVGRHGCSGSFATRRLRAGAAGVG